MILPLIIAPELIAYSSWSENSVENFLPPFVLYKISAYPGCSAFENNTTWLFSSSKNVENP